jgi:Protein of unknown function (DUF3311)
MSNGMSNDASAGARRHYDAPPANMGLLVLAGILLAIPIVALMLVNTYAKKDPVIAGFPFFFWYQFLWVFLCSGCTYAAYLIVRKARPHRPMTRQGDEFLENESGATGGTAR